MKRIIPFAIIVLLMSVIGLNSNAQKTSAPVLKFVLENNKILDKDIRDIEKLVFTVENLTPELETQWQNSVKEHAFIKKISMLDKENSNIKNGEIILSPPNRLSDVRKMLEGFGLSEFYVGDIRIITKTLLNNEEAQKKAMDFVFKDFTFTKECNDSTLIDYYDFQVYYFGTKLQFMWANNYAKYLFDGNVTKFTENLDKMIIGRENFKKNIK